LVPELGSETGDKIMKKSNAFTLIELLVVIAIIAILAAILFPVFATAREKARQSTCESNEKQIALGIIQYTQDYDEVFPGGSENSGAGWQTTWAGVVLPYIKSTAVFLCPDDPEDAPYVAANGTWAAPETSYVANGTESSISVAPWYTCGGAMCLNGAGLAKSITQNSQVNQPSASILIAEEDVTPALIATAGYHPNEIYWAGETVQIGQSWGGAQYQNPNGSLPWLADHNNPNGPNGGVSGVHGGLANFAFCDGHVKAMWPYLTNPNPTTQPQNNMWVVTR
jgi:prepilin-type N-terminal cleavage/methylation domain-containing protein/prepilin-type processing-associated H-X9-DG protein